VILMLDLMLKDAQRHLTAFWPSWRCS